MKTIFAALTFCAVGSLASASTLDFSGSDFNSTFPAVFDPASTATVTVDGVSFTVTAEARGTNGFRQSFDHAGLNMGVPGNGMYSISIVADADVTYTSFYGEDRSNTAQTTPQLLDLLLDGSVQQSGLNFGSGFATVDFADISASAGSAFKIDVDFTARSGYNSIYAVAVLGALEFEKAGTIPLPASLPMLGAGLGLLAMMRRRRRRA